MGFFKFFWVSYTLWIYIIGMRLLWHRWSSTIILEFLWLMMLQTDFTAMELQLQRDTGEMIAIAEDVQRTYKTVSGLHVYRHKYLYRDVCLICAWTGTLVFFLFTFICCPKALYEKGGKWTRENGVSYRFVGLYIQFQSTLHCQVSFSCECLCGQVRDTKALPRWGHLPHMEYIGKTLMDMEYTRLRCKRERSHHCDIICNYLWNHRNTDLAYGLGKQGDVTLPSVSFFSSTTAWIKMVLGTLYLLTVTDHALRYTTSSRMLAQLRQNNSSKHGQKHRNITYVWWIIITFVIFHHHHHPSQYHQQHP